MTKYNFLNDNMSDFYKITIGFPFIFQQNILKNKKASGNSQSFNYVSLRMFIASRCTSAERLSFQHRGTNIHIIFKIPNITIENTIRECHNVQSFDNNQFRPLSFFPGELRP